MILKTNDTRLEVKKTTFTIGNFEFAGYTADEIDPVTGNYINYLSGAQLAQSVGNSDNTVRHSKMDKELKALLGKDFTVLHGFAKMASGGVNNNLNLWKTNYAAIYWAFNSRKGNDKAFRYTVALASTTLDIIINDSFGRAYKSGDAQKMVNARVLEMQEWVLEYYNNVDVWLSSERIENAGYFGVEARYMANEAYLKEKYVRLYRVLPKKCTQRFPLSSKLYAIRCHINSVRTGLEIRKMYEKKMGANVPIHSRYKKIIERGYKYIDRYGAK